MLRQEARGDTRKLHLLEQGDWKEKVDALYDYRKQVLPRREREGGGAVGAPQGYAASLAALYAAWEARDCKRDPRQKEGKSNVKTYSNPSAPFELRADSTTLSLRVAERVVPCVMAVHSICSSVAQERLFQSSMLSEYPRPGSTPAELFAFDHKRDVSRLMRNLRDFSCRWRWRW